MRRISLLLVVCSFAPPSFAQAADPTGNWRGEIAIPKQPLAVQVSLVRDNQVLAGTITIPAQNAKDLKLSVREDGATLSLEIVGVPGKPTFAGKLDGDRLAGTFTQGGQEFAFALSRAGKVQLGDLPAAIERARAALDVPGLAVAIVKDGAVVLAQGFGVRDVDTKTPVTERSLFAIGSSTKAMTAYMLSSLLAAQSGEAPFTWDSLARDVVPGFKLADPLASAQCTLRDLASHRSGLPRHDLLWYLSPLPRAELLARLPHLSLSKPIRTQFQYCNFGYMVLGEAIARLSGQSWEDAVVARVFEPLGMQHSRAHSGAFKPSDDVATGHHEQGGALRTVPRRELGGMNPAGSVESCAVDLARWVLLQLGEGKLDGKTICDASLLRAQAKPLIPFGGVSETSKEILPIGYGLGWFVESYRGHLHVQHGGGIDGFIAHVGFFPFDGLGVVALANRDGTGLPAMIDHIVADHLLQLGDKDWAGEAAQALAKSKAAEAAAKKGNSGEQGKSEAGGKAEAKQPPAHPLADYAGTYADAGYGPVTVRVDGERLVIADGSKRYPLRHVSRETFALEGDQGVEPIAGMQVLFVTGYAGDVEALRVRLEPAVSPITFARRVDPALLDAAAFARCAGRYRAEDGTVVTVAREGKTLRLTVPGQPVYELKPKRKDLFQIGELDGYHARFAGDGETADTVTFEQPNGNFTFKRVRD